MFTLNLRGKLTTFDTPIVMGIVNVTPDSFYSNSRAATAEDAAHRALMMMEQGAAIIDVGGYSTRQGADNVSADEEYDRLAPALEAIRTASPEAILSVDTFRSSVARKCVERFGVEIINDVSGGTLDPEMGAVVADCGAAYVLMHMRGTPATMQQHTDYADITAEVMRDLAVKAHALYDIGVTDIIIDPGFGFAKTIDGNYRLLSELSELKTLGMPMLVGLSRKSMIYKALDIDANAAANGTTVLNTLALAAGADILRVHDVGPAVEAIKLTNRMKAAMAQ